MDSIRFLIGLMRELGIHSAELLEER